MTGAEPGRPRSAPAEPAWEAPRPVGRTARLRRVARRALSRVRLVLPATAALYLLGMSLPWFRAPAPEGGTVTVNGFDAGMLVAAAVVLVLAAGWTLLPARAVPRLPFPAPLVPAGLAVVCLLLTVPEWLTTVDRGFTAAGSLTLLSALTAAAAGLTAAVVAVRAWPAPRRTAVAEAPVTGEDPVPDGDAAAVERPQPERPVPAGPGLGRPWAVEARE
ncbi:hypothetical protein [uncultured Modestobacter sp.]|uniref:hypothetical protein n=1 Tax=uncultured Modestobacter sp. TaxID=380048 RepID=UPI00260AE5B5|nr:hypothetical protein [uncultured Modestobacter sp.]